MQACASITAGTTQSVNVDTMPVQQATCTMQNEKGQWTVIRTPGAATVSKAYGPLSVQCRTEAGHTGGASVSSTTAGAAYQYPGQVVVPLSPPTQAEANMLAMASATSPPPAQLLVLCRLQKVEEYRDAVWCKEAGGKMIRVGPPQQPVASSIASATPPIAGGSSTNAVPPLASGTNPAPMTGTTSQILGTCYLSDGSKEQSTKDACMIKKGFIGA